MSTTSTTTTTTQQPDIAYTPDYAKYQARRLRGDVSRKTQSLPAGFPPQLHSDLVWDGRDLAKTFDWTYVLTDDDVRELEDALKHFKALNLPLGHLAQDTFPLPRLHTVLRSVSRELHHGHGFQVVRGLPVTRHTRLDNLIMYAGISAHVAPLRARQDTKYQGESADVVLTHVKDLSASRDNANIGSPAYTTDKQVFHTDSGDIVSLFALSTAAKGGTSRLASTWRVYNELAATRPDLIATLAAPWVFENFGGDPNHRADLRPLLYHQPATAQAEERVLLQYARRYFTGFGALPRSKEIPPISEAQAEALDTLHYLGEEFNVALEFRTGDIQYVNNLALFHARDAFTDNEEQQRHLVRLWLRDPEYAWDTPEPLKGKWKGLFDGITPESQVFPVEPYIRSEGKGNK